MRSMNRTIRINPWSLAASLGRREGRWGIPRRDFAPAPGQTLLREAGNAGQSKHGDSWYRRAMRLLGRCYQAARRCDLATIKTRAARDRVARRARLIERFHAQPEMSEKALHRGMGNGSHLLVMTAFTLTEAFLNQSALLLAGESRLRLLYALGLGLAQIYLAKALGQGLRGREMGAPDAPSKAWLGGLATAAVALVVALAVLRAEALHLTLRLAISQTAANTGGSTVTTSSPVDLPMTGWLWFGLMQAAVFVAATSCARMHSNWVADQRDKLTLSYRRALWRLNWRLFWERLATAASDRAGGRWAGSYARSLEQADEAAHMNMVTQARYGHANLRSRNGELGDTDNLSPMPLEDKAWRRAPDPLARIGSDGFRVNRSAWVDFRIPAPDIASPQNGNGHTSEAVSPSSDRKDD